MPQHDPWVRRPVFVLEEVKSTGLALGRPRASGGGGGGQGRRKHFRDKTTKGPASTARALALLSQAGPALVAATGARQLQLLRGRSRFRGEWEQAAHPVGFGRAHCAASPAAGL
jgi:hypothetical protein